ncbi:hypothetical protein ACFWBN_07290 [Streptomyces sp. NPDC059989]|uniref:hypothetical protein n=1 Tax=Streptomyces sp. NPDC059989 TaxID=3347026 RepID=UPI0036C1DC59
MPGKFGPFDGRVSMRVQFDPKLLVSRIKWVGPISDGTECLTVASPLGVLSLRRCRSRAPSVTSAVGGILEDWKVTLNGEHLAEMYGVAPPGHAMRLQVRSGVAGRIAGDTVHISGIRSVMRRHRFVKLSSASAHSIDFRGRYHHIRAEGGPGILLAEKRGLVWEMQDDDIRTFAAVALIEIADLDSFLENPFLAAF